MAWTLYWLVKTSILVWQFRNISKQASWYDSSGILSGILWGIAYIKVVLNYVLLTSVTVPWQEIIVPNLTLPVAEWRCTPASRDVHQDSPGSAQVQPRFSPYSGHLRSSWNLHIICTMTRVVHMSKRTPSHPAVRPPEVIKGHEVKICTADCGSPRRARIKPTMPKYSQGRELTFPIPSWPLKVTTWPKVIYRVNRWNACTADLVHKILVFRVQRYFKL